MKEKNKKTNQRRNTNSEPNSHSRLGIFIFVTALATSLIVGGVVYGWQQKKFQDLKAEKDEEIKNLKEELNSFEAKIETLQVSSKDTQKSSEFSYFKDWETKQAEGLSFEYPNRIDSDYINITSQNWPPQVIIKEAKTEELICEPGEDEITLNKKGYCFNKSLEGTAGKTYKRYSWRSIEKGKRISLKFSLAFPSCGAIPGANNCEQLQSEFDPHSLADKILESISIFN